MSAQEGVMVFCEVAEGTLTEISRELLGGARRLADDLNEKVYAVIVGSGVGEVAQEAISFGADEVYVAENPVLKDYQTEPYILAMEKVMKQAMPRSLLLGQNALGRDLAPSLACTLDTAAVMDCVELAIDPDSKRILHTKPVYGGNALAVYTIETDPQIATVRIRSMEPLAPDEARQGSVIPVEVDEDFQGIRVKLVDKVPAQVEGIRLEDAKVVVGGGRGIGSEEDFAPLEELAALFDGAVGATRAVCDNGWLAPTKQIGLTGKVIKPDLYFAVAISGASQHMAGCYGARTIVAINRDDGAHIFSEADYGVIGDWRAVLPSMVKRLTELEAKSPG